MKQIVIGLGEVGIAIQKILECDGHDIKAAEDDPYMKKVARDHDVIHIAFPYSPTFEEFVRFYMHRTNGSPLIIVHSSVPVGTCDPHGWIHSPVRGIHPHLEEGIRTFTKFFGGAGYSRAMDIFSARGIKTYGVSSARETEAMKLWDTTIYGWNILIEKAIKKYCDENSLDFRTVYTMANATYNEGYSLLGHPEFSKYVLKDFPGPIGGHCVRENWELLDSPITDICKELHKQITDS